MFSILHVIVKTKTFFTEVIIHRTFFSSNKWLNRSPIIQRLYFFFMCDRDQSQGRNRIKSTRRQTRLETSIILIMHMLISLSMLQNNFQILKLVGGDGGPSDRRRLYIQSLHNYIINCRLSKYTLPRTFSVL